MISYLYITQQNRRQYITRQVNSWKMFENPLRGEYNGQINTVKQNTEATHWILSSSHSDLFHPSSGTTNTNYVYHCHEVIYFFHWDPQMIVCFFNPSFQQQHFLFCFYSFLEIITPLNRGTTMNVFDTKGLPNCIISTDNELY